MRLCLLVICEMAPKSIGRMTKIGQKNMGLPEAKEVAAQMTSVTPAGPANIPRSALRTRSL